MGGEEGCSRSLENAMVKNVEKEERRGTTKTEACGGCVDMNEMGLTSLNPYFLFEI